MAKSKSTFMKKELEKKRKKKKENKEQRKQDRKMNSSDGSLESMLAYVNEHGEIISGEGPKPPAGPGKR